MYVYSCIIYSNIWILCTYIKCICDAHFCIYYILLIMNSFWQFLSNIKFYFLSNSSSLMSNATLLWSLFQSYNICLETLESRLLTMLAPLCWPRPQDVRLPSFNHWPNFSHSCSSKTTLSSLQQIRSCFSSPSLH